MKTIINADDFGISPGVNWTVRELFLSGKLNSASLICGGKYLDEAISISKENPDLKTGLHFNLTTGFSCKNHDHIPLLTDKNRLFKNGFVKIFLLSIFNKSAFLEQVQQELEAQIKFLQDRKITLTHIDGHRHIHFIPGIFEMILKIAEKYQIPKIRIINENLFETFKIQYPKSYLFNGGIIKWLILRFCGLINGSKKISNNCYFFSILYTCQISKELISKIKIPEKFTELEIMIHPGNPELDAKFPDLFEKPHLLSANRYLERL